MAGKEATIYIVDQGASTGECHNGRVESDLDYGMRYIWDKIAETMMANRLTLGVGVVGFRTDETDNELAEDDPDAYSNISVLKALGPMQMPHLKDLQNKIKPSDTNEGDAISAIVVAIQLIEKFTVLKTGKPGKFMRKIVLLTDGQGPLVDDDIKPIAKRLNEFDIQLVVVGVDFDDPDFGFKEEDKSPVKARNEQILKTLTEECHKGVYGNIGEAIDDLSVPRVRTYRPFSTFRGQLSLGDAKKYPETAIQIDVERWFKTRTAKPPSASSFVTRSSAPDGPTDEQTPPPFQEDAEGGLTPVRNARTYKVNDPSAPGGKKDVEREELAKGYEYGRTAVHISESDENVTKLETFSGFEIVGFIPNDKYEKFLNMGESCITVAPRGNEKAAMALSSFIHSLHELDSYAIARIVVKDGKDPLMLLLAPLIEPDHEALVDVPLPFAEDIRTYRFPPLDRVITASGAILTKNKNLPSDELVDAMSDYVDSMDLSEFGRDDDDRPVEYMSIEETYSPAVHRINQAVRRRAVQPDEGVMPPADILLKYSTPPPGLISESETQLNKLIEAANVQKVPPKVKSKRARREVTKPLSGLDVESLLGRQKRRRLSTSNAIPSFKQMLESAEDVKVIPDATKQMGEIIFELIKTSLGDQWYAQALANLSVMREELIEFEEPGLYNDYIRDLKNKLLNDGLGEGRKDLWFTIIRERKLGLIDRSVAEASEVSEEEAAEFYSMRIQTDLPSHVKK